LEAAALKNGELVHVEISGAEMGECVLDASADHRLRRRTCTSSQADVCPL
jgi:hypothetical protein